MPKPDLSEYTETLRALETEGIHGTVGPLATGPIKSLAMLPLEEARILPTGLASTDGRWRNRSVMLIHRNKNERTKDQYPYLRLSQRKLPHLVLARPSIQGKHLVYTGPGMDPLEISHQELEPRDTGTMIEAKLHDGTDTETVVGVRESGRITKWIREHVNENCFDSGPISPDDVHVLIPIKGKIRRVAPQHAAGIPAETIYSDGGQVHVISQGTVDWMNKGLKEKHGNDFRTIPAKAFRYEILLEGLPPNIEDLIAVGQISLNTRRMINIAFASLCVRCTVPSVDIETGTAAPDKEPFLWLQEYRPLRDRKPTMGINAAIYKSAEGQVISTGDAFSIATRKP